MKKHNRDKRDKCNGSEDGQLMNIMKDKEQVKLIKWVKKHYFVVEPSTYDMSTFLKKNGYVDGRAVNM